MAKAQTSSTVGGAVVDLSLDQNPFLRSMRTAAVSFEGSLRTMGQQATKFGRSIGGALGFGGLLGGAGLAGFAVGIKKLADELAAGQLPFEKLAVTAGQAGVELGGVRSSVDALRVAAQRLAPINDRQIAAIEEMGVKAGKSGKALKEFLRLSIALSTGTDATPLQAAKALSLLGRGFKPSLEPFNIIDIPGEQQGKTLERAENIARRKLPIARLLQQTPQRQFQLLEARIQNLLDAFIEFLAESIQTAEGNVKKKAAEPITDKQARGEFKLTPDKKPVVDFFGEPVTKQIPVDLSSGRSQKALRRIDRAVAGGHLTQQQADELKVAIFDEAKRQTTGQTTQQKAASVGSEVLGAVQTATFGVAEIVEGGFNLLRTLGGSEAGAKALAAQAQRAAQFGADLSAKLPKASQGLRGGSQVTEQLLDEIADKTSDVQTANTGLFPQERLDRASFGGQPVALSNDELEVRRQNTAAVEALTTQMESTTATMEQIGSGLDARP